jgi:hypothetical protein
MDGSETRDLRFLGIGLYTVAEAARLTCISQGRLRRWLRGYTYRGGEAPVPSAPSGRASSRRSTVRSGSIFST